jgi:signal peptidase I
MLVYDNNHPSRTWQVNNWPSRWQSESGEPWQEFDEGRSFESPAGLGQSTEWARISYRHLAEPWRTRDPDKSPPRERLISDFYSYNAGLVNGYLRDDDRRPRLRWVGDLSLTLMAEVSAPRGRLRVELVEAGDRFICEFDLAQGSCQLLRVTAGELREQVLATTAKGIGRPGRYSIGFGNTDDRLTVWLDGRLLFGDGIDYDGAPLGANIKPTLADLHPASVAVQGTHVRLSDLVLYRDIYYTQGDPIVGAMDEYHQFPSRSWEEIFSDPDQWDILATARISSFGELGPDDFMMMGDNSPRSKDGRLWDKGSRAWVDKIASEELQPGSASIAELESKALAEIAAKPGGEVVLAQKHVVHRQLLIGRAFFVYWPHGVPFGPEWLQFDTPRLGRFGSFRVPFYPNVSRMKMIQ